jgi:hypothetical protein
VEVNAGFENETDPIAAFLESRQREANGVLAVNDVRGSGRQGVRGDEFAFERSQFTAGGDRRFGVVAGKTTPHR